MVTKMVSEYNVELKYFNENGKKIQITRPVKGLSLVSDQLDKSSLDKQNEEISSDILNSEMLENLQEQQKNEFSEKIHPQPSKSVNQKCAYLESTQRQRPENISRIVEQNASSLTHPTIQNPGDPGGVFGDCGGGRAGAAITVYSPGNCSYTTPYTTYATPHTGNITYYTSTNTGNTTYYTSTNTGNTTAYYTPSVTEHTTHHTIVPTTYCWWWW